MTAAATLAGAWLLIVAAGLYWTARLLHIGNLDAHGLAEKLGTPHPRSAFDWPEVRLHAVIPQPGEPTMVLLVAQWPAHPERTSTLLIDVAADGERALALLCGWCTARTSVSPSRRGGNEVELRRRQSLERVTGLLLAEDLAADCSDGSDVLPRPRGGSDLGAPGVD
ncbi:MAG TPA: hypothetical protein VEL03_17085 [Streptosporangiaceae bacterium]|nr:hypothetical protein [Streptosporangiaceae bacterium]